MGDNRFNFTNLKNIYIATLKSYDKSMAFDVKIGKGRFLFMMFLSDEDKDAKDMLFIYMRNTKVMCKEKMYGAHSKGDFWIYIKDDLKQKMIKELCLSESRDNNFDFFRFLEQLNDKIPLEISQETKIKTLRTNKKIVHNFIDEDEKDVLVGPVKLPGNRSPRDRTLRKLYVYTDADIKDIDKFIVILKRHNMTVAWTTKANKEKAADINSLISELRE